MFPKVPDQHKSGRPLVPNGLGVLYVLISTVYLFMLHSFGVEKALVLAGCVLFGGFLGLLDDWMDLRWRYKAFLPIFAAIPIAASQVGDTKMATYFFGQIDFGIYFYILIIPLIVTVVTNVVNQLGGLNGLETVCPSIVVCALIAVAPERILLYVPLAIYIVLAFFNLRGKIFVGNTGTFAIGITLASFAVIADIEQTLLISVLPYILNSTLILLNIFLFRKKAKLVSDGKILRANHRRSLVTFLAHHFPSSERKLVAYASIIVAASTLIAVVVWSFT